MTLSEVKDMVREELLGMGWREDRDGELESPCALWYLPVCYEDMLAALPLGGIPLLLAGGDFSFLDSLEVPSTVCFSGGVATSSPIFCSEVIVPYLSVRMELGI